MFTVDEIRVHIQDFPEKNFLLDEEEFSDEQLEMGIRAAISGFNSIPPVHLQINTRNMTQALKDIMLEGVLAHVYRGKSLQHFRNQLNFQDGGAAGSIDDKGQFYQGLASQMQSNFENRVANFKRFQNMDDGFGELSSDYSGLPMY